MSLGWFGQVMESPENLFEAYIDARTTLFRVGKVSASCQEVPRRHGIVGICMLIWKQFMSVLEELKGGKAPLHKF
nr:hypothetical protein CFP56_22820 [Quercus suber]